MCLKFLCCGGDDADDGAPASQPVAKPPSSHTAVEVLPPSGQLPSPAMNGFPTPSSATNGVLKTPGAAGSDNNSSHQKPGKFDAAGKEADTKSEEVKQETKANPDYPISSTTEDYKPSFPIKKAHKKDDSAENGGQDADVTSRMNQDHRLRRPSVNVVGSQANRGRINQDHEWRASTNEPSREAVDNRFPPRADDIGLPANPIPTKDQPRRGGHI